MKIFYFVCILSAQAQNGTASADVDERRRERPGGEKGGYTLKETGNLSSTFTVTANY
jgi:hypothetical protein